MDKSSGALFASLSPPPLAPATLPISYFFSDTLARARDLSTLSPKRKP